MLRVGGVEKSVDFRPVKRKHWRSLHMCQLLQRRQTESAPTNPHFSTPSCTASCHPCWPSAASAAAAWPDTWWRNDVSRNGLAKPDLQARVPAATATIGTPRDNSRPIAALHGKICSAQLPFLDFDLFVDAFEVVAFVSSTRGSHHPVLPMAPFS